MKLSQSYQYTGSSEFTFDNVLLGPTGIALFDQRTGIGLYFISGALKSSFILYDSTPLPKE